MRPAGYGALGRLARVRTGRVRDNQTGAAGDFATVDHSKGGTTGPGGTSVGYDVVQYGETLPGRNDCDGAVPWLDEDRTDLVVNPGQTAGVTVTLDERAAAVPGDYVAGLDVCTDSPYATKPIGLTMHVTPPASWGKAVGTAPTRRARRSPAPPY